VFALTIEYVYPSADENEPGIVVYVGKVGFEYTFGVYICELYADKRYGVFDDTLVQVVPVLLE